MIFVPAVFRGYDYPAMLARVAAKLSTPPEVVVVRGHDQGHGLTEFGSLLSGEPLLPPSPTIPRRYAW